MPLQTIILAADSAAGVDSAMRAYRNLRDRLYGRDAYDFGERSLLAVAQELGRAGKGADALALLTLNESYFPASSMTALVQGNLQLTQHDTTAAVASFRTALQRDSTNLGARRALQQLGQRP